MGLPKPCSAQMLSTVTVPQPSEWLAGPVAALSRSELLGSLCCACPCHCTLSERDRPLYMLYESGIKHRLLSTWAEF